jgi:hypothetical protein
MPQRGKIHTAHVPPCDSCELWPEAFAGMEVRSIRRQALHMNPLGCAIRQAFLNDLTAMDGSAIPDEHHTAGHLAPEVCETRDDVG